MAATERDNRTTDPVIDKVVLESFLAKGMSLKEIGRLCGRTPGTVGYWVKRHGLRANGSEKFRPGKGLDFEPLAALVANGLTLTQIADELGTSVNAVRTWVKKHGLELAYSAEAEEVRKARAAGVRTMMLKCPRHGATEFQVLKRSGARCKRCQGEAVAARRRKVKRMLVEEAGGACRICGYDGFPGALHFHHLDPNAKRFGISRAGVTRGVDRAREEVEKCVLLCANCHAEVEWGHAALPVP